MKKIIVLFIALIAIFGALPVYGTDTNIASSNEPSSWAMSDITILEEYGVLDQRIFSSYKETITRLDFIYLAVVLYEAINEEEIVVDPNISFVDTKDIYVLKGATVGITSGLGDGRFGPEILLTREQLATMFVKALELANREFETSSYKFSDDQQISTYAKSSIYKAYNYKIINGNNNKVNPKGNASIEQSLLIFKNIYDSFVLSSTSAGAQKLSSDQLNNLCESVVRIYAFDDKGNFETGSGFFYEKGKIGLNYHVIKNAETITIKFNDSSLYSGDIKVLGYDQKNDLAAISITQKTMPVSILGDSDKLVNGQSVYSFGSKTQHINNLLNGSIRSVASQKLSMSVQIEPITSGGVLLDDFGKVVGITNSDMSEGDNLGTAIPINIFKNMPKTQNLSLYEFAAKSTTRPSAVTGIYPTALDANRIEVFWADNGADCYYLYEMVNGKDWVQLKNSKGSYKFNKMDSHGVIFTGYQSGQKVTYAITSEKSGLVSEKTLSETILLQSTYLTPNQMTSYLEENLARIRVNNYFVNFYDYLVLNQDKDKVSVSAVVLIDSYANYMKAENAGITELANELRAIAEMIKVKMDKDVEFHIAFWNVYKDYPVDLPNNYIYHNTISYESDVNKYYVYFPLIQIDTTSEQFRTWRSVYNY